MVLRKLQVVTRARFIACSVACVLAVLGCQSPSRMNLLSRSRGTPETPPQSLVALWQDSVMNQPGAGSSRGLGGRLYFYDEKHHPVPVDGKLVVYAYDDSESKQSNREPDRKFVFDQETLRRHFSESDLGPSYSVWLPWDKVGGKAAEVSLIPVLTTAQGKVVIGEHSRHVLTGTENSVAQSRESSSGGGRPVPQGGAAESSHVAAGVHLEGAPGASQLASFQQERPVPTELKKIGVKSTAIRLPDVVKQRLVQSEDVRDSRLDRRRAMSSAPWTPATGATAPTAIVPRSTDTSRSGLGNSDSESLDSSKTSSGKFTPRRMELGRFEPGKIENASKSPPMGQRWGY